MTTAIARQAQRGEARAFFLTNVDRVTDDCVIWPFAVDAGGYGKIRVNGRNIGVHREACRRAHGEPPTAESVAMHGPCHEPRCFNGRHLHWGTDAENQIDKVRDGTVQLGEAHPQSRFTEAEICEMRRMAAAGHRTIDIADRFGTIPQYVYKIVTRRLWRHV